MKETINSAVINLISVNSHIRQKGMKTLKEIIYTIDKENYQKISYGLFHYFWFSDGYEQQQQDIDQILEFLKGIDGSNQLEFFKSLVLVFIKYSNSIDWPRQDKYSLFYKQLFIQIYQLMIKDFDQLLQVQEFLIQNIFFHEKGRLVAMDFFFQLKQIIEEVKPGCALGYFCIVKPFFDFIMFQNQQGIVEEVIKRFGENFKQKLNELNKEQLLEIYTYIRPYLIDQQINIKKKYFQSVQQILNKFKENDKEKQYQQNEQELEINKESNQDQKNGEVIEITENSNQLQNKNQIITIEKDSVDSESQEDQEIFSPLNSTLVSKKVQSNNNQNIYFVNEIQYPSQLDQEEQDDEEFSRMQEEANFPPYWFKSRKQKRKFFNKLNNEFQSNLIKHKIHKTEQTQGGISIKQEENQILKFDKNQKVNKLMA